MKKFKQLLFFATVLLIGLGGCSRDPIDNEEEEEIIVPPETETVVLDSVVEFTPINGTTIEENIIEYIPGQKIVLRMPGARVSGMAVRYASTRGSDVEIVNFNTRSTSDLSPGMTIAIPPFEAAPFGTMLKIDEIHFGQGSVVLWGTQPMFEDIFFLVNERDLRIDAWDFVDARRGSLDLGRGWSLVYEIQKIDATRTIAITKSINYNFKHEASNDNLLPFDYEMEAKLELTLSKITELRDVGLLFNWEQRRNSRLPQVFEATFDGELNFRGNIALDINLAAKFQAAGIRLLQIPLGAIPVGPVKITPSITLDFGLSARGSLQWDWTFFEYTQPFFYSGGYRGRWFVESGDNRGYRTRHDFPWLPDIQGTVSTDFKFGIAFGFFNWDGLEGRVGAAFTPTADVVLCATQRTLAIDVEAPVSAFADFEFSPFFGLRFAGEVRRELFSIDIYSNTFPLGNIPSIVNTLDYRDVTNTTATITGAIDIDYTGEITDRGFFYSTNSNPNATTGTRISTGSGPASFFAELTNLTPNTTYYYVAYAVSGGRTRLGAVRSFTTTNEPDYNTTDEGVVIGGRRWATRNLDYPGTFAPYPHSAGRFYQWGTLNGETHHWASAGAVTGWNSSSIGRTFWTTANDPCPTGWRVPARADLFGLVYYTTQTWVSNWNDTGVGGVVFGTAPNQMFLPAVGLRAERDGSLVSAPVGSYWSRNPFNITPTHTQVHFFEFSERFHHESNAPASVGLPIRCVAE